MTSQERGHKGDKRVFRRGENQHYKEERKEMSTELQPYPEYKDTDVEWLVSIPVNWNIVRTKGLFRLSIDKAAKEHGMELLSIYTHIGVRPRKDLEERGNKASNTDGYWIVRNGDLIVNKLLAWMGAIGVSHYEGVTSPAYDILRPRKALDSDYYHYLFRTGTYLQQFKNRSRGIMEMRLRLYFDQFGQIPSLFPPMDEQNLIVNFLHNLDQKVSRFIRNRRGLIEILNEQKQAIINKAVTQGLVPNVPLKPSGVDWLGDIPEHWDVLPLKRICKMKNGEGITTFDIEEYGEYPVYGGNGLRGYTNSYTHDGYYVLVGRQGALCGNVHLVSGRFWASEHAVVTTLQTGYCIDWFVSLLMAMELNQYSISAAQPGLSVDRVINLRAPIPPVEEQKEIAKSIKNETQTILKAFDRAQREIDLIREYRTRLISDVVTGKVDVRHLAPAPGSGDLEEKLNELEPLDEAAGEPVEEALSEEVSYAD